MLPEVKCNRFTFHNKNMKRYNIKMPDELVEIDGSLLEGGGQILRISLTISVLCKIPIHVKNIRAGRSKPGLMAQHLKGVHLIRDFSHGILEGDHIGSTEIKFWPNIVTGGHFTADTKTAGSITLLLQVALPCLLFANTTSTLTLIGGTNTEMAPQVDYMTEVFRPNLEKFGATFDFELIKRGYFPKGGGIVKITINPVNILNSVEMIEQGHINAVYGWSFVAGTLPVVIAEKSADAAVHCLKHNFPQLNVELERYKESRDVAPNNCSGLILVAETSTCCILGTSSLGKKNLAPEHDGKGTAQQLVDILMSGSCLDQHCQDQMIIFMALARGKSQIKVANVTMHTQTAIYITEKLAKVKFNVQKEGENNIISCTGIGYSNKM